MDQVSVRLLWGHNGIILVSHNGNMLVGVCRHQQEPDGLDNLSETGENRRRLYVIKRPAYAGQHTQ